ncbi:MAG: Cof-type HAD-IIB family hydrolase [Fimbriimonadaceae bacterium]|nr:Cof-type HAD-IIB family hydrolase [Fimbriimonadaceae bacterium]
MIRLAALDMDGTLLGPDRRLAPEVVAAVREARDSGVTICLASGRAPATLFTFQDELEIRGPLVCSNGAFVLDDSREEIFHASLSPRAAGIFLEDARSAGLHVNLYSRHRVFTDSLGDWARLYQERTGVVLDLPGDEGMEGHEATKVLLIGEPGLLDESEKRMKERLTAEDGVLVRSEPDYLEFLPPGVNKSVGLARLAERLGLHRAEVAALGDYWNDLEMLQWAGFSGAMLTAPEEVRAAADVVVPPNTRHGAAAFLHLVLDRNRAVQSTLSPRA